MSRAGFLSATEAVLAAGGVEGREATVVLLDLVGFGEVNDDLGHTGGDQLLRALASRLLRWSGSSPLVGRVGDDEFALLLPGSEHRPAEADLESLVQAVSAPVAVGGVVLEVCVRGGLATAEPGQDGATVVQQAATALREAKRQDAGAVVRYEPELGERLHRRRELVDDLRKAIAQRELRLVYQPVLKLITGEILGVEALARWRRGGVDVPPDVFIPAAEESGLIVALGELVIELVVADAPALWPVFPPSLNLAVNVSPQQLRSRGFVQLVREAVGQVAPLGLVLEVTERDFVDDDPVGLAAMAQLDQAGVPFAIDDFGIGYSSLGYLQELPFRILKIDKSFAEHIDVCERACNLLRSMALVGDAVGLDVVIEGIERPSQAEHLVDHVGDVYGQGYLIHRPMPLAELVEVLAENRRSPHPLVVGSAPPPAAG